MRTHLVILLSLVLGASACKKKDEAKPSEPATAEKKADEAAKPTEPAAPAGAVKIADASDYETKATDLTNKLLGLFTAAGKDCDKLAADLTKFGNENKPLFESLKAFEQANPDAEKAFDEKMKAREKDFEAAIGPAFEACKDHAGLQQAMQSMPMD